MERGRKSRLVLGGYSRHTGQSEVAVDEEIVVHDAVLSPLPLVDAKDDVARNAGQERSKDVTRLPWVARASWRLTG